MKRHEFRLEQSCSAQAATVADRAGVPLAEFIRRAVVEKLEREFVLAEHAQLRDQLEDLVGSFREEIGRLRTDLVADNELARAAIEAAANDSLRKNEELTKHFVRALTTAVGGAKPGPSCGRSDLDEDAPMPIPG